MIVSTLDTGVADIGIVNMSRINDRAAELYASDLVGLSYIKEANINLIYLGRARSDLLLSTTIEEPEAHAENIKKYTAKLKENLEMAKPLFLLDGAEKLFAKYEHTAGSYEKQMWETISLAKKRVLAAAK